MALDSGMASENKRVFTRTHCGAECAFVFGGNQSRAMLLDASRGGFKLRFEQPDAVMAALTPLPRDIIMSDQFSKMHATVMWASGGLAGCRFYQHLSLDDVVRMMGGNFRLQLVPLAEGSAEASRPS